jgi:hypothetical protein
MSTAKIEKVEKGVYRYRGVHIFRYDYQGFSYKYSTRTDKFCRSDFSYPVALKFIASKIDEHIDSEGVVVDPAGYVVRDTRTKVGA